MGWSLRGDAHEAIRSPAHIVLVTGSIFNLSIPPYPIKFYEGHRGRIFGRRHFRAYAESVHG